MQGCFRVWLTEGRNALSFSNATLIPLRVVRVDTSSSHLSSNLTWLEIGQLILSLLAEFANDLPLGFHIDTALAEPGSAIVRLPLGRSLARLVSLLSLLGPLLTLFGLLGSLVHNLVRFALFLLRRLQLLLVGQRGCHKVAPSATMALLHWFLVLNSLEFVVFCVFNKGRLCGRRILFGRLPVRLVLDNVCGGSSLDLREIAQLSDTFHLVVWLEQFAIELVLKLEGGSNGPKTFLLLVVDAQIVNVEVLL